MALRKEAFVRWSADRGKSFMNETSALVKEVWNSLPIKAAMWSYSKKTTICEPESNPLLDTEFEGVLILDF